MREYEQNLMTPRGSRYEVDNNYSLTQRYVLRPEEIAAQVLSTMRALPLSLHQPDFQQKHPSINFVNILWLLLFLLSVTAHLFSYLNRS